MRPALVPEGISDDGRPHDEGIAPGFFAAYRRLALAYVRLMSISLYL